jgi:uncharacterized repeat protein (TIGR02543 family)
MNRKTLYTGGVVSLLLFFAACEMAGQKPGLFSGAEGKAAVHIRIDEADMRSRTAVPKAALQDVTKWELWGGEGTDPEILQAEFSSAEGTTILLEPGTWHFTLKGYKDNALILSGSIGERSITLDEPDPLIFTAAPVLEGEGTIRIVVDLPAGSGITEANVFKDETPLENESFTPVEDRIIVEGKFSAGDYYFTIRLYKDSELYGVVSEIVQVRANLQSEKIHTLTWENLNAVYVITYHKWDTETETVYYRYTDPDMPLADLSQARPGYTFGGWYDNADFSGGAVTVISTGSTGDKDFYARWADTVTPSGLSLAESLAWISANMEGDGAYTIILKNDEAIEPQTLSYTGTNIISITLTSDTTEQTVSLLNTTGSLFTVGGGVTLTLGNNVTLQGRSDNTAPLVTVAGTLVMNRGAKITGNSAYRGGVSVFNGTFTMNGGTISGNSASSDDGGGGVFVFNGTFTMNGGTISGNSASSRGVGGGVFVSNGTFTMNGGTISGNSVDTFGGGGVYVDHGEFTMND